MAYENGESFRAHAAEEQHFALQRSRAARTVAGHAADEADCRMLLSVLGLEAEDCRTSQAAAASARSGAE